MSEKKLIIKGSTLSSIVLISRVGVSFFLILKSFVTPENLKIATTVILDRHLYAIEFMVMSVGCYAAPEMSAFTQFGNNERKLT